MWFWTLRLHIWRNFFETIWFRCKNFLHFPIQIKFCLLHPYVIDTKYSHLITTWSANNQSNRRMLHSNAQSIKLQIFCSENQACVICKLNYHSLISLATNETQLVCVTEPPLITGTCSRYFVLARINDSRKIATESLRYHQCRISLEILSLDEINSTWL